MRYEHGVKVICDGCGKRGDTRREVVSVGGGEIARVLHPAGWRGFVHRPAVALPPQATVDPFVSTADLARVTGQPVEGVLCTACAKRLEGEQVAALVRTTHEVPSVDAQDGVIDPNGPDAERERDRIERERAAEEADRAAFEAKRAADAAGGA